jgi:hypothetical protein
MLHRWSIAVIAVLVLFAACSRAPDWRLPPPRQHQNYLGNLDLTQHDARERLHYVDSVDAWWVAFDDIADRGYGTVVVTRPINAGNEQLLIPGDVRMTLTSNCDCSVTVVQPLWITDSTEIYRFLRSTDYR